MSEKRAARQAGTRSAPLLHAGAAAAVAGRSALGAQALSLRAATPAIDFSEFPICRTASDAPPLTGAPRKLKLSWNAGAVCLAPVPVAIDHGFFQKQNLDVELVNYSGSTDQLLEAIATGKADAGLGMALRWLKPLEQGFDVKITAGTHGGCMRVLTRTIPASSKLADLKGKIVAVGDLRARTRTSSRSSSPSSASIRNKDVDWRVYPGDLLNVAVEKGEVQAFLVGDPLAYLWLEGQRLQGGRDQPGRRIRDKTLLHPRRARQPDPRGPQVARAADPGAARGGDVHRRRIRTRRRNRSSPMRRRRRRSPI